MEHVPRGMSGLLGQSVWQCGTFTQRVHAAGAPALTSFNNIHTHFLAALRSGRMSLRRQMTSLFPGIVERKHAKALTKLAEHVNSGSTLVVGGSFSIVRPTDNHGFFKKAFALNWKAGSCHRATFSLNPAQPERAPVWQHRIV